ncbi:hypothetical protein D3C81_1366670 [compost metagenome]
MLLGISTRKLPEGFPAACSRLDSSAAISASIWRACAWHCWPSAVSDMLRVVRCKRRTPKCFSSAATWFVTDEVEIPRRCAALLKPPASTTAQNTCIASSLSMHSLLFDYDYPRY